MRWVSLLETLWSDEAWGSQLLLLLLRNGVVFVLPLVVYRLQAL
jgi:hypothetical protein